MYNIGFALSGGFIKGFAHLGAVQALYERNIYPDIISGVSAGALAGVFLADGKQPKEILKLFDNLKFTSLTTVTLPKCGIFKLNATMSFIRNNVSVKRIEDLKIPFIISATDIAAGKIHHFYEGDLAERVVASCCVPTLFEPVNVAGTDYVDGGVFMNLPVTPIRDKCKKVIAVSVESSNKSGYKRNLFNIASRSFHFMTVANTIKDKSMSDLLIVPKDLSDFSNIALDKAGEIFDLGYKAGLKVLSSLSKEEIASFRI